LSHPAGFFLQPIPDPIRAALRAHENLDFLRNYNPPLTPPCKGGEFLGSVLSTLVPPYRKTRRAIYFATLALLANAVSLLLGCAVPTSLRPDVKVPERSAIIFFVDGLNNESLDHLSKAGRLPTIKRQFIDGGLRFTQAYSCLPSDTYPNSASLLTGLVPGRHGVVGNLWFDRRMPTHADYTKALTYRAVNHHVQAPTIYELIRPLRSVSMQCATARGASADYHGGILEGLQWVGGNFSAIDTFSSRGIVRVIRAANHWREWPALQMYYFPAVDKYGHEFGPHTPEYEQAIEHVDLCIGHVLNQFDRLDMIENTLLLLISDHAQMRTTIERQFDPTLELAHHFGDRLAISYPLSGTPQARHRTLRDKEVLVIPFRRRLELHVRGKYGWRAPATPKDIAGIADEVLHALSETANSELVWPNYIDMLVMRAGNNRGGVENQRLRIWTSAGQFLVDENQTDDDWVGKDRYPPGTLRELRALMRHRRAGDIQIFAAPGCALLKGDPGGHGGISRTERHIPMFFSARALASGQVHQSARLVDVMPTIMEWLGCRERIPTGLDGRSLMPQLVYFRDKIASLDNAD